MKNSSQRKVLVLGNKLSSVPITLVLPYQPDPTPPHSLKLPLFPLLNDFINYITNVFHHSCSVWNLNCYLTMKELRIVKIYLFKHQFIIPTPTIKTKFYLHLQNKKNCVVKSNKINEKLFEYTLKWFHHVNII